MKMKKTLLAASLAVAMSGLVTQANAGVIKVADAGRVTLAPLYIAEPGFTTKITVSNPHSFAVKAKIVFRSSCTSEEMMDFVLYLSPRDVWTGTLSHNGTTVVMSTSDDSSRIPTGAFNDVSPATGANAVPFFDAKLGQGNAACVGSDFNTIGHFEVTAAYSVEQGFYDTTGNGTSNVRVRQTMSKSDLFVLMNDVTSGTPATAMRPAHAGFGYSATTNTGLVAGSVGTSNAIDSDDGDTAGNAHNIRLVTDVLITHPNGASATYHAPSLYNDPTNTTSAGQVTGLIDNATYDALTGMDTRVGEYYRAIAGDTNATQTVPLFSGTTVNDTGTRDGIGDVEAAVAATNMVVNYLENSTTQTGIVVSFPTRYRHRVNSGSQGNIGLANPNNVDHTQAGTFACSGAPQANVAAADDGFYTSPFEQDAQVPYTFTYTDLKENQPTSATNTVSGSLAAGSNKFDFETQFFQVNTDSGYEEGQAIMSLSQSTGRDSSAACDNIGANIVTTYSGVPAVGVAVYYDPSFATATMARIFGSYDGTLIGR